MREHVVKSFGFVKTTALGGVIFLLPLIVVGALVGQAAHVVWWVASALGQWLPVATVGGYGLVLTLAMATLVSLCFTAGLVARRSLGRRLTETAEKKLMMLFPRYAIFKDQLAGNIGGEVAKERLKPVLAQVQETLRLGLEVDRNDAGQVTVYFPSAPDPWTGTVAILQSEQVTLLDVEYAHVLDTFEKLGRGSLLFLNGDSPIAPSSGNSAAPGAGGREGIRVLDDPPMKAHH